MPMSGEAQGKESGILSRRYVHLLIVVVLGVLAYSNTFDVPFQFDDRTYVLKNPLISRPVEAPESLPDNIRLTKSTRLVAYFTFLVNYKLHGESVAGYHVLNLLIHILNGLFFYYIVLLTLRTPRMKALEGYSSWIALFSALLFVSHPIQTEAVTYISQRFTSLAALFCLSSLFFYIKWRRGGKGLRQAAFYAASFVSIVLAMKTKENSFVFPLIIALYEFSFFDGPRRKRLLYLLPLVLAMVIVPLSLIDMDRPIAQAVDEASKTDFTMSRWQYFTIQLRVIATYLRLLVLPFGQNLDYEYPDDVPRVAVAASAFLLILLLTAAVFMFGRTRLRPVSFGIFWFFTALSVESSFMPLSDLIFEHRAYLPSAGAFLSASTALFLIFEKGGGIRRNAAYFLAVVPVVFLALTYARNNTWRSEASLWKDVVGKSPGKARGYDNLGTAFMEEGEIDAAIERYRFALKLRPNYPEAHFNLGNAYRAKGMTAEALRQLQTAIRLKPDYAEAHNNLGVLLGASGMADKALEHFRAALRLRPNDAEVYGNLGNIYSSMGMAQKAVEHYEIALRISPDDPDFLASLGNVYSSAGRTDKALEYFGRALRLRPDDASLHNNIASVYGMKGDIDGAVRHLKTALKLRPDYAEARCNLGNAYKLKGDVDKAISEYTQAIGLRPDYADAHFNLGLAYVEKGFIDEGRAELQAAIGINPGYAKARQVLDELDRIEKKRP